MQEAEGGSYTHGVCSTYVVLIKVKGSDYEAVVVVGRRWK